MMYANGSWLSVDKLYIGHILYTELSQTSHLLTVIPIGIFYEYMPLISCHNHDVCLLQYILIKAKLTNYYQQC